MRKYILTASTTSTALTASNMSEFVPYYIDDNYYHPDFPLEWAQNHLSFNNSDRTKKTGPKNCKLCATQSSTKVKINSNYLNVFYGYCYVCSNLYCKNGFLRNGPTAPLSNVNTMYDYEIKKVYPYIKILPERTLDDMQNILCERQVQINWGKMLLSDTLIDNDHKCNLMQNILIEEQKIKLEKTKLNLKINNKPISEEEQKNIINEEQQLSLKEQIIYH